MEFAKKCVILHPLSREKRGKALTEWTWGFRFFGCCLVSYLSRAKGARRASCSGFWPLKNFFEKKLRKNLVVKKKPLTFANAFANKRKLENKEIVLWKTLDKQTKCSTSSSHVIYIMYIRDEVIKPSIWLNNQEIFGHLNRGKSTRKSKKIFYNEEFDPGSGWTLATGLTHASRGAAWT